jgi:hypothetical protein
MERSDVAPAVDQLWPLTEAVSELIDTHPSLFCDAEAIKSLERERARLDFVVSRAVATFEQCGEWALDGAQTPAAWLDTRCHLPNGESRAQVRRGRALSDLPLAAAAWSAGDITAAHVDALIKVKSPVTEEALARDEKILVQAGVDMKFRSFCAAVSYWDQHADPDGAEEADMAREARRDVYLFPSTDGFLGSMRFNWISGAIVSGELQRLEAELFEADWAKAKEELGRNPHPHELARTSSQRRADAMVEMATRSAAASAGARRPEPLFSVLVDYPTLAGRICQLEQGSVLSPGSLLPWLDRANFERIVFAPGKRIECSPLSRFFTGATRRAIEVRDLNCCHEFCDLPAAKCQIDHMQQHCDGGLTTQENGQALCGFHNRLRNQRPPPAASD